MKTHQLATLSLFLTVALALAARYNELDGTAEVLFRQFIHDHNKVYSMEEYPLRLSYFKANLRRIDQLNSMPGQRASFGINKFSDLSRDEFASTHLLPKFDPQDTCIWPYHRVTEVSQELVESIPKSFDWRSKGCVTPVKNQGDCGSCWTFSTTGNMEGQWKLWGPTSELVSLSEQWIVDCSNSCLASNPDLCNGGCYGGLPWLAYEDIMGHHGLTSELLDPYTGEGQLCAKNDMKPINAKIFNWTAVPTDPKKITAFMYSQGPLSITLNAALLMSYTGGVIVADPDICPNDGSDHAVLLVGYGMDNSTQPEIPYWIVKNSWGEDWGDDGYFMIESDQGLCGINACVTTTLIN